MFKLNRISHLFQKLFNLFNLPLHEQQNTPLKFNGKFLLGISKRYAGWRIRLGRAHSLFTVISQKVTCAMNLTPANYSNHDLVGSSGVFYLGFSIRHQQLLRDCKLLLFRPAI